MSKLSERAMLVTLNLSAWQGQRIDRQVTDDVIKAQHADKDAGRWQKNLVPPSALEPIQKAQREARAKHNRLTLAWGENSARILTSEAWFDYSSAMDEERAKCEKQYREFAAIYPSLVAEAPKRLNGTYRKEDFPEPSSILGKFGFKLEILPVPDQGDFRVTLGEEIEQELRASIEASVAERSKEAEQSLWQKVNDALAHFAATMSDPKRKFRDSTVHNMVEMAQLAPKLSLTRDPVLIDMCQRVAKLYVAPSTLRKSTAARRRAGEQAKALLAELTTAQGA